MAIKLKSLNELYNNDSAILFEWLIGLAGLFMLISIYAFFMPVAAKLAGIFVENGAPLAPMTWTTTAMVWTFTILGIGCILYPFIATYRKTYDSGVYQQQQGWQK